MVFTEKEMREDLHKVRIRKYLYLGGGLLILVLAVALLVIFVVNKDWPAFALSMIGLFWCVMLAYHFKRTHSLEKLIRGRVEEAEDADGAGTEAGEALEAEPGEAGRGQYVRGTEGGAGDEP